MEDRFKKWKHPKMRDDRLTKWNWAVKHTKNLKLGDKTDIGAFTYINAKAGVEIGDNVEIGSHCSIYSVSTIDHKEGKVTIGKNAKNSHNSIILKGQIYGRNEK